MSNYPYRPRPEWIYKFYQKGKTEPTDRALKREPVCQGYLTLPNLKPAFNGRLYKKSSFDHQGLYTIKHGLIMVNVNYVNHCVALMNQG